MAAAAPCWRAASTASPGSATRGRDLRGGTVFKRLLPEFFLVQGKCTWKSGRYFVLPPASDTPSGARDLPKQCSKIGDFRGEGVFEAALHSEPRVPRCPSVFLRQATIHGKVTDPELTESFPSQSRDYSSLACVDKVPDNMESFAYVMPLNISRGTLQQNNMPPNISRGTLQQNKRPPAMHRGLGKKCLNLTRETLQHSNILHGIKRSLVKKGLATAAEIVEEDNLVKACPERRAEIAGMNICH